MLTASEFFCWNQLKHTHVAQGHQYVSKNVIKIGGDFGAIFWKKAWAIVQGIFQILVYSLKWP